MTAAQLTAALDPKRLATAQARAALAGITLVAIEGDNGRPELVASRWGLTRRFSGDTGADVLTAAEQWLTTVTGKTA